MTSRHLSRAALLLLLTAVVVPTAAEARPTTLLEPTDIAGNEGVRTFIGVYGDLNVDDIPGPQPVTGTKFVFGGDLILGKGTGTAYVVGLHMGAGNGDFVLQPLFEVHYRFALPYPIVPWVGGGASLKLGFGRFQATNLAITFRLVFGAEWFLTDTFALGTQLAIPDIGPRILPSSSGVVPIGTIEWIIGPHFRF